MGIQILQFLPRVTLVTLVRIIWCPSHIIPLILSTAQVAYSDVPTICAHHPVVILVHASGAN